MDSRNYILTILIENHEYLTMYIHVLPCRCKLGYFALREDDPKGCIPCFCFGHSSDCSSAMGYYATSIISDFETGMCLLKKKV